MTKHLSSVPDNLDEDGEHVRVYGTTYYGRRYLSQRKNLTPGEAAYVAWLREKSGSPQTDLAIARSEA